MKFLKEHSLFLLILLSTVVLRFIPFFEYQFTLDELSGLIRTQFNSFGELIEQGVKIDAHPALIQVLIYYLSKAFGYGNWVIKLPFLLFSLGTIIYAYCFGLRNFSKRVGLFAALVFSFSLVFVFYSSIARMYISGIFFSMALLFHFYEIFFLKNNKNIQYFFLGLFALLSAFNHHINALFALTLCFSGLFFLKGQPYKKYLITCALVLLAYLPHLPVTLYQLGIGGIGLDQGGWLEKPEFRIVLKFLQILFGTGVAYSVFVVLIIFKNVYESPTPLKFKHVFLLLIFFINYWIVYTYSVEQASIYQHSAMLFSGVCMVFVICSLIDFTKAYFFYPAFLLVAYVLINKTYFQKDVCHQTVKTVFEYQFERTTHYKKLYGDKNVCPIFFDADDFMKKIYFEKYKTSFDCKISADPETQNIKEFSTYVAGLSQNYLVLASSMPVHAAVAKEYFPYLIENTQTQAINFKVYSKVPADSAIVVKADRILSESTIRHNMGFKYPVELRYKYIQNNYFLKVDSTNEFPFGGGILYKSVIRKEGQVLIVKTKLKLNNPENTKVQACVSVLDHLSKEVYQYAAHSSADYVMRADSTVTVYADLYAGSKHDKIKGKSSLNCYLWNPGKEKFKILDFEVTVVDYWPQKWGFWK